MSSRIILDEEYKEWIGQLSIQYRNAQIKAAVAVNTEMLKFYWELGQGIESMQADNKYGSRFFDTLSRDLKAAIPEAKGFSSRNLQAIRKFYIMYSKILPQVAAESQSSNMPQLVAYLFRIP